MAVDLLSGALPTIPIAAPPTGLHYSAQEIDAEAERLAKAIGQPTRWSVEACAMIAPMTLRIAELKKEKDVFLLAHSYQTPDIVYGVADAVGDSYGLAKLAKESTARTILFSSVRFMAETAKILNPDKLVLHPSPEAGCSLSEGITAADVHALREAHPGAPIVCYVNTTAEVKAACDVCVTSSNYLEICEKLPGKELVFVPDRLMGAHLQTALAGKKTVHIYDADCEVHAEFTAPSIAAWRAEAEKEGRKLQVLAHPECAPDVVAASDFVGSSEKMMDYAKSLQGQDVQVMPITECGTADRLRKEVPGLEITGACVMCRHMKRTGLEDILQALEDPRPDQIVELAPDVITGAARCLDRMFELA